MRLIDHAEKTSWDTVSEPTSIKQALKYVLEVWGEYTGPRSFGMVMGYKMLQWISTRL